MIHTARANASDYTQFLPVILDVPRWAERRAAPEEVPDEAYADRGYDSESLSTLLRWLGIEPRIAKRRTPHSSGLRKIR